MLFSTKLGCGKWRAWFGIVTGGNTCKLEVTVWLEVACAGRTVAPNMVMGGGYLLRPGSFWAIFCHSGPQRWPSKAWVRTRHCSLRGSGLEQAEDGRTWQEKFFEKSGPKPIKQQNGLASSSSPTPAGILAGGNWPQSSMEAREGGGNVSGKGLMWRWLSFLLGFAPLHCCFSCAPPVLGKFSVRNGLWLLLGGGEDGRRWDVKTWWWEVHTNPYLTVLLLRPVVVHVAVELMLR